MDKPTFLQHLRRSLLLPDAVIDGSVATLPEQDSGALAQRLVADKMITRYQASQLLKGKSRGFLLGPYRIMDQIGQGGMGTVFKAMHTTMDRFVAIKVLKPRTDRGSHDMKMFQREVRAAAQLHHPNLVTAFDANETMGICYLVMEYVDGPNLERLVRKSGVLPIGLACIFMRQTAEALAHAHSKGMVHRDIKPANILIGGLRKSDANHQQPTAKILDFGLARLQPTSISAAANATIAVKDGAVFGTPDYISPEQAHDVHGVDNRSDLYSLGCSFYYALTGRPPFAGENSLEKLVKHLTADPEPLESKRRDVPPGVAAIVHRCMAKDPADRFQSAQELIDAVSPFCPASPGSAHSIDTLAGPSLKTPAGSDAELGEGWKFEPPDTKQQLALPTMHAPALNEEATRSAAASSPAVRHRPWLWAAVVVNAILAAALALILIFA